MKNIFDPAVVAELISRINKLNPDSQPRWGSMSADQMLAHCNVSYEMLYEDKHPAPNPFLKMVLTLLVKRGVVGEKPYKQSERTAPAFIIQGNRDFAEEKARLIAYMHRTADHGSTFFEGKESHSFGKLTAIEWSNMLYKHLEHHLSQFGV